MGLEIESSTVTLRNKPGAPLHYSYLPATSSTQSSTNVLLVFVNGMGLAQAAWIPAVMHLCESLQVASKPRPAMLLYDRFGQGRTTTRDPLDADKEPGYGHDLADAADDFQAMIQHFSTLAPSDTPLSTKQIVLVGNSIGCPITRLHIAKYPGTVSGVIMLDSNIANNDQVNDMWPNPESADFDPATALPPSVRVEELVKARQVYAKMFGANVKNPEGLDRRNAAQLLPHADQPALRGLGGTGPLLYVVGHDPEAFANQSEMMMGVNRALTAMYPDAVWGIYNEGLAKLSNRSRGPIIAKGCGHFIQKDGPAFVAKLIAEMLDELAEGGSSA